MLPFAWHQVIARFCVTYIRSGSVSGCENNTTVKVAYLSLAVFHVDLVPENNKGEVLRVMWARLDQKLVPPTVQRLEGLQAVHIVDQHAAVCTTIESNTERLKALLTGGVPQLR